MERKTSWLKLEIVRQGRIQADVAKEAGMSESRLSRIVTNRDKPHEHEIRKLAKVLGHERAQMRVPAQKTQE